MQGSIPVNNFADVCLIAFPRELHLNMLTFLRATDLSALQQTCHCFNNRALIAAVVGHAASEVVSAWYTSRGKILNLFAPPSQLSDEYILLLYLFFASAVSQRPHRRI